MVVAGCTVRDPLGCTIPMPLSSSIDSAPSTSHESTVADPAATSGGTAMNRWIARGLLLADGSTNPQAAAMAVRARAAKSARRCEEG